jgi:hypothetical protein
VVDRLAAKDMLDCLVLLHYHAGSQLSSIIPVKQAIREAANIYVELAKMGAHMKYLDVGGGLAVDYDGSKTDFHASKNYNIPGVRLRHRLGDRGELHQGGDHPPDHRERVGPSHRPRTSRSWSSR